MRNWRKYTSSAGSTHELAVKVADQLMAKDALGAHARDELGISEITTARPIQAALTSAATFAIGAAMPLLMVVVSPSDKLVTIVSVASLAFLALLGSVGAKAGGANVLTATARVTFWARLPWLSPRASEPIWNRCVAMSENGNLPTKMNDTCKMAGAKDSLRRTES